MMMKKYETAPTGLVIESATADSIASMTNGKKRNVNRINFLYMHYAIQYDSARPTSSTYIHMVHI